MRLTRREFIQASAASAGVLVTGCATTPGGTATPVTAAMAPRKAKAAGPAKGTWVASTCQGCTQWCAIQLFVEDGRAVRVRGNPLSKTNHGYCCPRGHLIPQQMYDPDRIKVPLKRTNPAKGRGVDPKWVPITWDEALDTVAEKMMELRRSNEAHKFVYIRGRYSSTATEHLYGTLPKIYGTTNYFSHSAICAEAEKMGPGPYAGLLRLPRLRPREDAVPRAVGHRPARVEPHGAERDPQLRRDRRPRHGDRGRPAAVERRRQGARVAAREAGHRRCAGRRGRPRAAHGRPVEPRVRRRFQGQAERVQGRPGRRRRRLRGEGDLGAGDVVEPRAQGPDAGVGREGMRHPGGADRPRGARDGQGGIEVRRLDGTRRGDEPPRHLRLDGRARTERHRRLDRHRGRRLAGERILHRRVPEVRRLRRRPRQGRRQVQEARRPRREGDAGDDERAAGQRRGHEQHRQWHAEGPGRLQGAARAPGRTSTSPAPARSAGTRRWRRSPSSCTW